MTPGPRGVEITCDKLASLDPTWAPFPGLTVLFDEQRSATVALYSALSETVGELTAARAAARYGLGLLPPDTFHVTVCDGPNIRRRARMPRAARAAFDDVIGALADLPAAPLPALPAPLRLLYPAALDALSSARPLNLRLDDIEVRGHAVVAGLRPADDGSSATLAALERRRLAFATRLDVRLGIGRTPWQPHVTIGYLANTGLADGVRPLLAGWRQAMVRQPELVATFTGAALFGFTDMTTFIPIPAPPQ
jgi:hypothetical protein